MAGGFVSYCVNIYLWDLELLVPLPPSLFSLLQWSPVSEAVHMNSSSSGAAVSVSILCAPLGGMYPRRSVFFLFLFSSYPYRKRANSRPCRIPSTSAGPLGCRATLRYLSTFIFSSRSVPLGTRPLSLAQCCTILGKTSLTAGTCHLL